VLVHVVVSAFGVSEKNIAMDVGKAERFYATGQSNLI
jgi:hypothetical protein